MVALTCIHGSYGADSGDSPERKAEAVPSHWKYFHGDFRCNSTNRASVSTDCRSVQVVALIASGKKIFLLRVVGRVNNLMKLSDVQMAYFLCDKLMLRFSLTWYHFKWFFGRKKLRSTIMSSFYVIYLPLKFALKYIMMKKTCKSLVKSCSNHFLTESEIKLMV